MKNEMMELNVNELEQVSGGNIFTHLLDIVKSIFEDRNEPIILR